MEAKGNYTGGLAVALKFSEHIVDHLTCGEPFII